MANAPTMQHFVPLGLGYFENVVYPTKYAKTCAYRYPAMGVVMVGEGVNETMASQTVHRVWRKGKRWLNAPVSTGLAQISPGNRSN